MLSALLLFSFLQIGAHAQGVKPIPFPKKEMIFSNGVKLKVEVARSDEQRARGLMYRTSLPEGTGMLFVFPREMPLGFWMKNTLIPLTIGYFDKRRVLSETLDMDPPLGPVRDEQLPRYQSKAPGLYALEVPRGWFAAKKIKPGMKFTLK
jgi:uncharacterized membrane protein (UPF0127 family)